jgi:hypothetical protein
MLHHTSGSNHLKKNDTQKPDWVKHKYKYDNRKCETAIKNLSLFWEKSYVYPPVQLQITKTKYPINIVDQQKGRQEWSSS